MGLMTPEVDGARQELPYLDSPEVDGARQPIASVKKYVDGAWVEIYPNKPDIILLPVDAEDTTNTNGDIIVSEDYKTVTVSRYEDTPDQYGSLSTKSRITFRIDGEWSNPTVSLDWWGGCGWWYSEEYALFFAWYAGLIQVSAISTDGSTKTRQVSKTGLSENNSTGDYQTSGNVSESFDGDIKTIIVRIILEDYSGADPAVGGMQEITITNVQIDGETVGFDPLAENYSAYLSDYD